MWHILLASKQASKQAIKQALQQLSNQSSKQASKRPETCGTSFGEEASTQAIRQADNKSINPSGNQTLKQARKRAATCGIKQAGKQASKQEGGDMWHMLVGIKSSSHTIPYCTPRSPQDALKTPPRRPQFMIMIMSHPQAPPKMQFSQSSQLPLCTSSGIHHDDHIY